MTVVLHQPTVGGAKTGLQSPDLKGAAAVQGVKWSYFRRKIDCLIPQLSVCMLNCSKNVFLTCNLLWKLK